MASKPFDGKKVLIVEDELLVAMLLEDMLGQLGCEVVASAGRIEEARSALDAHPVDLAILDMNLNGQRTTPLADVLASRGVPFVFATGYGERDIADGHQHRPLLTKPFLEADLAAAIARALTG